MTPKKRTDHPRKTHQRATPAGTPRMHHSVRHRLILVGTSTNDNTRESSRDPSHCSSAFEVDEETCESLDSLGRLTPFFAQSAQTTSKSVFGGKSVAAYVRHPRPATNNTHPICGESSLLVCLIHKCRNRREMWNEFAHVELPDFRLILQYAWRFHFFFCPPSATLLLLLDLQWASLLLRLQPFGVLVLLCESLECSSLNRAEYLLISSHGTARPDRYASSCDFVSSSPNGSCSARSCVACITAFCMFVIFVRGRFPGRSTRPGGPCLTFRTQAMPLRTAGRLVLSVVSRTGSSQECAISEKVQQDSVLKPTSCLEPHLRRDRSGQAGRRRWEQVITSERRRLLEQLETSLQPRWLSEVAARGESHRA